MHHYQWKTRCTCPCPFCIWRGSLPRVGSNRAIRESKAGLIFSSEGDPSQILSEMKCWNNCKFPFAGKKHISRKKCCKMSTKSNQSTAPARTTRVPHSQSAALATKSDIVNHANPSTIALATQSADQTRNVCKVLCLPRKTHLDTRATSQYKCWSDFAASKQTQGCGQVVKNVVEWFKEDPSTNSMTCTACIATKILVPVTTCLQSLPGANRRWSSAVPQLLAGTSRRGDKAWQN